MGRFNGQAARCVIASVLVLFGAAAASACGGGDEGSAAHGPTTPEGTFCAGIAVATCSWATSCCELSELEQLFAGMGLDTSNPYSIELIRQAQDNPAKCVDLVHSSCVSDNSVLFESIRAGRVTLNKDKLGLCVKEFRRAAAACDIGNETGPTLAAACDPKKMFTGKAVENDACFHDLDCVAGTFCWRAGGTSGAGICRPVVPLGKPCRDSTKCDPTAVCVPLDTRTSTCVPLDRQPEGAFCIDDPLSESNLCAPDLFCNTLTFACEKKRPGGGECNAAKHCLSGRCNRDTRQCEPQVASGERCSSSSACQDGLWCDPAYAASFCTKPLQTGQAGDSCGGSQQQCGTGLVCVSGICQEPLIEGQLCTSDAQCMVDAYCQSTTNICVTPRKADGDTCQNSRQCAPELYCDFSSGLGGNCQPRVALGDDCTPGTDSCAEGARCDSFTAKCATLLNEGDNCSRSGDCSTGLICEQFAGRCETRLSDNDLCDVSDSCPVTDYCSPSTDSTRVCRAPLPVAEGQSCSSSSVACSTGLYCASDGLCHALSAEGQHCLSNTQCVAGLHCDTTTDTCARLGTVGASCTSTALCADGLYCGYQTGLGACRAYGALNDACSTSSSSTLPECDPKLAACTYDTVKLNYYCTALPGNGQSCTGSPCMQGFYCPTGVYTCTPVGGSGASCSGTDYWSKTECGQNLQCLNLVCTAPGSVGASCSFNSDCATGLACDFTTYKCVVGKTEGQDCTSTSECGSGLSCRSYAGRCSTRTAQDAPCIRDDQCAQQLECVLQQTCDPRAQLGDKCDQKYHLCGDGLRCDEEWALCEALDGPLPSGARCHVNAECLSGRCTNHICTGACQGVGH